MRKLRVLVAVLLKAAVHIWSRSDDEAEDRFVAGMDMGPTIARAMNGEIVNPYKAATEGFAMLMDSVLRPPRAEYDVEELGPTEIRFGDLRVTRTDLELGSKRVAAAAAGSGVVARPKGDGFCASRPQGALEPFGRHFKLSCSWWQPADHLQDAKEQLPCVVYLHANCGARPAALEVLQQVLPHGHTLFTLDFGACGHSDGEYLSLGYWEQEDVAAVMEYLRGQPTVSSIALWGRSMGAVTALLYACRDRCGVDAVIADSAFSHMRQLSRELVNDFTAGSVKVPTFAFNMLYSAVRKSAMNKAHFDSNLLNPIERIPNCRVPVLFGVADDGAPPMSIVVLAVFEFTAGGI